MSDETKTLPVRGRHFAALRAYAPRVASVEGVVAGELLKGLPWIVTLFLATGSVSSSQKPSPANKIQLTPTPASLAAREPDPAYLWHEASRVQQPRLLPADTISVFLRNIRNALPTSPDGLDPGDPYNKGETIAFVHDP